MPQECLPEDGVAQNSGNGPPPRIPKILLLATAACAYPGADYVGQTHAEYPVNTYIVRVPSPAIFPPEFYLDCFAKGIDGIVAMSCGQECPYPGAFERFTERVGVAHSLMKQRGLDPRRLRACAICTVCSRAFLKEVQEMAKLVSSHADTLVGVGTRSE